MKDLLSMVVMAYIGSWMITWVICKSIEDLEVDWSKVQEWVFGALIVVVVSIYLVGEIFI